MQLDFATTTTSGVLRCLSLDSAPRQPRYEASRYIRAMLQGDCVNIHLHPSMQWLRLMCSFIYVELCPLYFKLTIGRFEHLFSLVHATRVSAKVTRTYRHFYVQNIRHRQVIPMPTEFPSTLSLTPVSRYAVLYVQSKPTLRQNDSKSGYLPTSRTLA